MSRSEQRDHRSHQVQPLQIERVEPNVLTLDYVDITAGGETQQERLLLPRQRDWRGKRTAWHATRGTVPCSTATN